jgi:hypothetical protein
MCFGVPGGGAAKARDGAYPFSVLSSLPCQESDMAHNIAGIDVHKKLLVVVVVNSA